MRVLVIDNAPPESLSRPLPLNEAGCSVVVHDTEKGLQELNGAHDVIIVRETPDAASWQLCEKIRRVSTRPLIVISTFASAEASVRAIKAGADYFLRKPFGPLELSARVRSLLRRSSPN